MDPISRRVFVRHGTLALLALGLPPDFLTRSAVARAARARPRKTLICIFQRGAVDGLSMVVPFGDRAYYQHRGSIAIAAPRVGRDDTAVDLDGRFGLHPALRPLADLYRRHQLAVVHAVGSPNPTRSHFDAQDFMETATPGVRTTRDGWLNRVLRDTPCPECAGRTLADGAAHAADHAASQRAVGSRLPAAATLRGVALGAQLPLSLRGDYPTLAISDLQQFGVAGGRDPGLESAFTRLYRGSAGINAVDGAAAEALEAVAILKQANPLQYRPAAGIEYPAGPFGRSLQEIAQLVKADVGLEIAFADVTGWDTHRAQGGADGQLARRLDELARGLRALHDDLGDRMADVVVLTMSEFGRTVAENGTGGTDHGHANCMLVLGGGVQGGRVLADWPGLEPEQLYQGRDLAVTTDFRDIFAEIVVKHLGAQHLERVFPGYAMDPGRYRGVL